MYMGFFALPRVRRVRIPNNRVKRAAFMPNSKKAMDAVCLAVKLLLESGSETYRAEETAVHMFHGFGVEQA